MSSRLFIFLSFIESVLCVFYWSNNLHINKLGLLPVKFVDVLVNDRRQSWLVGVAPVFGVFFGLLMRV